MATSSGVDNAIISNIFWPTEAEGITLEQLKQRRAIAAALASKGRDYPNTIGKGIFSLGESFAGLINDRRLDLEEKAINKRSAEERAKNVPELDPNVPPPPAPRSGPVSAAPASATVADAGDADITKNQMVEALLRGQAESRPAPAQPLRMASLSSAYASDAGQPGATYGGPSPAGPGASMAEPPDQSPPTPSASPAPAGPGPTGTPAPVPATGGGVAPSVDAGRTMLTDAAMANQDFNLAGPQMGPPPQPPVQLAQVGGFGGSAMGPPSAPAPATLPGVRPMPQAPNPGDPRPQVPETYQSPTEAQWNKTLGPRQYQMPPEWDPGLLAKAQKARKEMLRSDVNEKYILEMKELYSKIVEANTRRFNEAKGLADTETADRKSRRDRIETQLQQDFKDAQDPAKISARNQAIVDGLIQQKTGLPGAEVRKQMDGDLAATRTAVDRQSDYTIALDAINKGIITGTLGDLRLNVERAKQWLTGNEAARARIENTEVALSRLKAQVAAAVKGLQPISNVEIALGHEIAAAGNNLQVGTIRRILEENMKRNNATIAKYDTDADQAFGGIPKLNKHYQSPEINYIPKRHLERLFADAPNDPNVIQEFNARYGPGSAETMLNRKRLNPGARYAGE